jgi:hypothetical protein
MPSVTSTRPAKSAPGTTPAFGVATVKLLLLGPPGAGKRSLLAAMPGELAKALALGDSLNPADALLLVCEADQSTSEQEAALEPWLAELQRHIEQRGENCEVGGLPLYLVLTKADRLALPGDSHAIWLERIEGAKESASAWLEKRLPKLAEGFGGVAPHVWATALRRQHGHSGTEEQPFGVLELAKHAVDAARRYQAHRMLQRRRTRAVIGLVLLLLVGMLVSIVYWTVRHGGLFDRSRVARSEADQLPLDQVAEARKLLDQSARVLSFGDYRTGDGSTDWVRWRRDAETLRERLSEAIRRDLSGPGLELTSTGMDLAQAARAIDQVRIRAELLGLGASGSDRVALLRGPDSGTTYATLRESTEEAYRRLAVHHRTFRPEPLPADVPLGVVHEIQSAAQSGIDRFCEPVRREIRQRVLQPGGGKETLEAWEQLRDGWLRKDADNELKVWRDLIALLQALEGRSQPNDPVQELRRFLSTPGFVLSLDDVELQFAVVFEHGQNAKIAIRRVQGPLEVRRQRKDQTEVIQLQVERERLPERWLFRAQLGDGKSARLELQPGDEVWARVRLEDVNQQTWLLTWSPGDSSSRVFSFEALTRAPRLHPENQPDPTRGIVAHGVTLRFEGADALRLPLLFPR